jgi:hypothetical protein
MYEIADGWDKIIGTGTVTPVMDARINYSYSTTKTAPQPNEINPPPVP